MPSAKAYSYVRFSSALQAEGDSHRRQSESARIYAQQNRLELVESFEDIGVSAFRGKHLRDGQLGVFRDLVQRGKIERGSYLLIESLDRLSRAAISKQLGLFTQILAEGIVVVTLVDQQVYTQDRLDKDPSALFLSLGAMIRAHDESRTKSERLKAVWVQKRRTVGERKLTKTCPAWLKVSADYKSFELIPERVKVVRQIFDWACNGFGNFTIARRLNSARIAPWGPTRKKKARGARVWMESYVTKIMQNRAVLGEAQFHRYDHTDDRVRRVAALEPIPNYYPVIIDETTFHKAQEERRRRRLVGSGRKGKGFANLFARDLLYCAICKAPVWYVNKGEGSKGGQHLRCSTARSHGTCNAYAWRYQDFEDHFLGVVQQLDIQEVIRAAQTDTQLAARAKRDLKIAERSRLTSKIERLISLDVGDDGTPIPELRATLLKHQATRDEIDAEIEALTAELLPSEPENLTAALSALKTKLAMSDQAAAIEELESFRASIAAELRRAVSRIELHTYDELYPSEVDEKSLRDCAKFPQWFQEQLGRDIEFTVAEIQKLLATPYGKRLYAESQRYFTIRYKNGAVQFVKPAHNINMFMDHAVRLKKSRRASSVASIV